MRYFIELSYKGKNYSGWQRQLNAVSVQQVIEEAFLKMLRQKVEVVGCGRTDTGVHAKRYIAHIDCDRDDLDDTDFIYHLNCVLPSDISIQSIYKCEQHARFDAIYREYQYRIALTKNPFETEYSWRITTPLDVEKMQKAADAMRDHDDFGSMCKVGSDNKTTICEVYKMDWEESENMLTFTITANRFLRGMVRAIVGTLVDVGRGKIDVNDIHEIMLTANRSAASAAAPAQGLFLTDIKYKKI